MSKNKVSERCQKPDYAKFNYAAKRMFFETKLIKVILYVIAIIPVVLTFTIPSEFTYICSIVSFALSIINEASTSFSNEQKKKAVMELQLYETSVTGSEFSKIEYDRETTNELNELAIRKGMPKMQDLEKYDEIEVPEDITDDYSYLYICRRSAATNRYLLSRIFYIYFFMLMGIIALFLGLAIVHFKLDSLKLLTLIIGFYPLISPIIKDCGKCKECMKDCTKICADIDNFFADGDDSLERLARMYYYVQNLEFEMMTNRPAIFNLFNKLFTRGIRVLQDGVTVRFRQAIVELKTKSLMHSGAISQPKGKTLITKVDYDLEKLKKIQKNKKAKAQASKTQKEEPVVSKPAPTPVPKKVATPAKQTAAKAPAKSTTSAVKTTKAAPKKDTSTTKKTSSSTPKASSKKSNSKTTTTKKR